MKFIRRIITNRGHVFLLLLTLVPNHLLQSQTAKRGPLNKIHHFAAAVGTGHLTKTTPFITMAKSKASLVLNKTPALNAGKSCDLISLQSNSDTIVTVGYCKSDHLYLCPGGIDNCTSKHFLPTKQSHDNGLTMRSTFTERRYVVEFHQTKFVYRIQKKNCLLGYPHGCLIHGFGWDDRDTYVFNASLKKGNP